MSATRDNQYHTDIRHPFAVLRNQASITAEQMAKLLAENVTFHSPLLVKPLIGRDLLSKVFSHSSNLRRGKYVAEYQLAPGLIFLWWKGTIDGRTLETLELLMTNEMGLVTERRAGYRPYASATLFRQGMKEVFGDVVPEDYWDWPQSHSPVE
jgi:hypothetical protein